MSQAKLPPLPELELGEYIHYKAKNVYRVTAVARHSETLEPVVVYETQDGKETWVRPYKMFVEEVQVDKGVMAPRFAKI